MIKLRIEIEIETDGSESDIECDLLEHFMGDSYDSGVTYISVEKTD